MTNKALINDILNKVRLKLFRPELEFFGILSSKFKWKVVKTSKTVNGYILTDGKTGKHLFGTIYLSEHTFEHNDFRDICHTICHELMHILDNHGTRGLDKDKDIWNFATDHVINRDLRKLEKLGVRPRNFSNLVFFESYHKENPNATAEDVYKWLKEKFENGSAKKIKIKLDGG